MWSVFKTKNNYYVTLDFLDTNCDWYALLNNSWPEIPYVMIIIMRWPAFNESWRQLFASEKYQHVPAKQVTFCLLLCRVSVVCLNFATSSSFIWLTFENVNISGLIQTICLSFCVLKIKINFHAFCFRIWADRNLWNRVTRTNLWQDIKRFLMTAKFFISVYSGCLFRHFRQMANRKNSFSPNCVHHIWFFFSWKISGLSHSMAERWDSVWTFKLIHFTLLSSWLGYSTYSALLFVYHEHFADARSFSSSIYYLNIVGVFSPLFPTVLFGAMA